MIARFLIVAFPMTGGGYPRDPRTRERAPDSMRLNVSRSIFRIPVENCRNGVGALLGAQPSKFSAPG
jgi:hypothetical protein